MTNDLKQDIQDLIKSTMKDLDDYFNTGIDSDLEYRNAQFELLSRLQEIVSRYSEENE